MKKIKNILRRIILKIYPKAITSYEKSFIKEIYKIYMKIENIIKYGNHDIFTGISIETSTYCNRRCVYCPNHNYETPKLFADEKVIYKAISDLSKMKYSGWLAWNFYNEPTLDNRLIDFIKYTSKIAPRITNILISNGDFLNIEKALEYKNSGIDQFIVTIHDKNPDKLYSKLLPIKEKIGDSFILKKSLLKEELYTRAGNIETDRTGLNFTQCNFCINPAIDKDGNMLMCCNDYLRESKMGNIMDKSILEIWNDKRYKTVRKELKNNLAEAVKNKTIPEVCIRCYYSMNGITKN